MTATVNLAPLAKLRFVDNNGVPLAGGKLFTYVPGSTTKQATYTDASGATPNSNPVILDSRGEASVWPDVSLAYKFVLSSSTDTDPPTAPIWTVDNIPSSPSVTLQTQLASSINAAFGPAMVGFNQTLNYATGVGARLLQTLTDSDFPTLQAAVTAAAGKSIRLLRNWAITGSVAVASGTTIVIDGGATITLAGTAQHAFDCTGSSKVWVFGPGKVVQTGSATGTNVGIVNLDGAIDCLVYGVEMSGYEWAGIRMNNAVNCHAVKNYIHDIAAGNATTSDSNGITMHRNTVGCSAHDNRIVNFGCHGVLHQDPSGSSVPLYNRITENLIDGGASYGVIVYQIGNANTYTLVEGNQIQNITGVYPGGSGGAGIYIQASGGVTCANNRIRWVCSSTSVANLAPAGIGVNGVVSPYIKPNIVGNTIADVGFTSAMVANTNPINLGGITVISTPVGALITANVLNQSAALTTPGFISLFINNSSNVTIDGADITLPTTGQATDGVFIFATAGNINNFSVSGVNQTGGTEAGLRCDRTSSNVVGNVTVNGYLMSGGSAACIPLKLNVVAGGAISNFRGAATTTNAATYGSCTNVKTTDSSLTTTGGTAISTSGTCTGSYIDSSVDWNGAMLNGGTGFNVRTRAAAMPTTGTWQQGDIVENTAIANAAVIAWGRATSGSGNVLSTDWFKAGVYS